MTESFNAFSEDAEWVSSIVWECAAKEYRRRIELYYRSGSSFEINDAGRVAPTTVFMPGRGRTGGLFRAASNPQFTFFSLVRFITVS